MIPFVPRRRYVVLARDPWEGACYQSEVVGAPAAFDLAFRWWWLCGLWDCGSVGIYELDASGQCNEKEPIFSLDSGF